MKHLRHLFMGLLLSVIILAPNTTVAQIDDDPTGEGFVQTAIDFGIIVSFDKTTNNVFEGKSEKLKTVLEAVANGEIEANIDAEGARQLEYIFNDLSDKGIITPDKVKITSALSNIYNREDKFPMTSELASLLLDSAYNNTTVTLEEIAATTTPTLPSEVIAVPGEFPNDKDLIIDEFPEDRQMELVRNWIILIAGLAIIATIVVIVLKKKGKK